MLRPNSEPPVIYAPFALDKANTREIEKWVPAFAGKAAENLAEDRLKPLFTGD
jgi:hypothetical protein